MDQIYCGGGMSDINSAHAPHTTFDGKSCHGDPTRGPVNDDSRAVEAALRRAGMVNSGGYLPAYQERSGRWSVDPSTLLLLLTTFNNTRG